MIFSKFERLTAGRYLRAKRKEGFISVITAFAFTGIALGVDPLIIVMSVTFAIVNAKEKKKYGVVGIEFELLNN